MTEATQRESALSDELGPLPETGERSPTDCAPLYSADQMRAYALQERAAERERCAMACWYLAQEYSNDPDDDGSEHWLRKAEAAIRARGANPDTCA